MRNTGTVNRLIIGSNAGDEEHENDTEEFRIALAALLALQGGPALEAPAFGVATEELLRRRAVPEALVGWTFSCHVS